MTTVEEPKTAAGTANEVTDEHSTTFRDVEQLAFLPGLKSLSYIFWICGGMEMVERLAYYGVKAVAVLYVTNAASTGALGATISQYGTLMMTFAFVSTILPVFTGGLSDRHGYKRTIFASTVIKISGYLVMSRKETAFRRSTGVPFRAVAGRPARPPRPASNYTPRFSPDGRGTRRRSGRARTGGNREGKLTSPSPGGGRRSGARTHLGAAASGAHGTGASP